MIKSHRRVKIVNTADHEISDAFWKFVDKYDLTSIECQKILIGIMSSLNRYMLRTERHPDDPDKSGDEE